jgi:hypothetical protein
MGQEANHGVVRFPGCVLEGFEDLDADFPKRLLAAEFQ